MTAHVSGAAHAAPPTHKANTGRQPEGHTMGTTDTNTTTATVQGGEWVMRTGYGWVWRSYARTEVLSAPDVETEAA